MSQRKTTTFILIILGVNAIGIKADEINKEKCDFEVRCSCYFFRGNPVYKVDCSKLNLMTIPSIPNNTVELNLSWNKITSIPDLNFSNNERLLKLDLSHNQLQPIAVETFYGLHDLQELSINNNLISEIASNVFKNTPKLQILNINNNAFDSLSINFSNVPLLTTLNADLTQNDGSNKRLENLPSLRNLIISGLSGKCKLTILTAETFQNLQHLESIVLSDCQINCVYKGTFQSMKNLSYLDISYNKCLKFSGVENITYDLPHTSIRVLKVNKVHQTYELNTELKENHVINLKYTNLSELHMDSNRIQLLEVGVLRQLPRTLRLLSLADNEFSPGSYFVFLSLLPVEILNVSFSHEVFDPFKGDEKCSNERSYEPKSVTSLSSHSIMPNFNLESNGVLVTMPLPPNLIQIIFTNSKMRFEVPRIFFTRSKVRYADLSFNLFYSLIGPVEGVDTLEHLDLSNNFCSKISTKFFENLSTLKNLFLQDNLLGFVLPDDSDGEIFRKLTKLKTLDLSNNRIPMLPYKFFHNQKSLKTLNISLNMLDDPTFGISHMSQLELLDLSNNRISYIGDVMRNQLDGIYNQSTPIQVDLSGNRLLCTCDTIAFVQWITVTKVRFRNSHQTLCKLPQKNFKDITEAQLIYSILKKDCSSYVSLIVGLVVGIVFFSTVLIIGLLYRHRWKLRYLYYMVKGKYSRTIPTSTNREKQNYEYDAFISYANEDRRFVIELFLKNLESIGLKLCIHSRDFLPGNDIQVNITSAIHNSRKTVVIMSHNYIKSYWCMFEYNMAKMESIYSRNKENIMYLVFLEQMLPRDLPLHILELVQSQSFIEYPNDSYGDHVFWEKMKQVLQS